MAPDVLDGVQTDKIRLSHNIDIEYTNERGFSISMVITSQRHMQNQTQP